MYFIIITPFLFFFCCFFYRILTTYLNIIWSHWNAKHFCQMLRLPRYSATYKKFSHFNDSSCRIWKKRSNSNQISINLIIRVSLRYEAINYFLYCEELNTGFNPKIYTKGIFYGIWDKSFVYHRARGEGTIKDNGTASFLIKICQ